MCDLEQVPEREAPLSQPRLSCQNEIWLMGRG
jgi:hypothetical protein